MTLEPYSLQLYRRQKRHPGLEEIGAVDILAELLDLLDLGGQAIGESLLQCLL